jgi:hypothetical protein
MVRGASGLLRPLATQSRSRRDQRATEADPETGTSCRDRTLGAEANLAILDQSVEIAGGHRKHHLDLLSISVFSAMCFLSSDICRT